MRKMMQQLIFPVITSLQDYLKAIELIQQKKQEEHNNSDLLFRGQPVDRPLVPRIGRIRTKGDVRSIEMLVLKDFQRGLPPLTEFDPSNDWDLIALAQHHGLPTRLLDWTNSALVGLWFAVEKPPIKKFNSQDLEDGVIWILETIVDDFRIDTSKAPFHSGEAKIFRSSTVSRRISSQAAVFSSHAISEVNGKVYTLEESTRYSGRLHKCKIPSECFSNLRQELHLMGINNATIFPDLDGFCRHLEWRYSHFDDE